MIMSDTSLKNFVCTIKGVLDKDICESLIDEYKKQQHDAAYSIVEKTDGFIGVDKEVRLVKELSLSSPDFWIYNSDRVTLVKELEKATSNCLTAYNHYLLENNFAMFTPDIRRDEGFKLLHYKKGYKFTNHVDGLPEFSRVLTCSIALNSDFDGGDFTFFGGEFKCDVEEGDAIVFPSNFMFPHSVTPIEKGERFSVITWLH